MTDERMQTGRSVLIADDDVTSRMVMEAALADAGMRVLNAPDGEAAVRIFEQCQPDLVLLDVEMPGLDGFGACREIRRIDAARGGHVPVVMVTGLDDHDSVARAYESGATQFITKPVHVPSLGHQVRYILRSADAMRELKALEEQTRAIVSAIPDAMLRLDRLGRILDYQADKFAPGLLKLPLHAVGARLSECIEPEVAGLLLANVGATLDTRCIHSAEFALVRDKASRFYEARYVSIGADEVLVLCRDISERKASERRIHDLAYRDGLTGLANRQAFLERVDAMLPLQADTGGSLAVLFMDIGGFKRINDTLGHAVGDHLLQAAAQRLRAVTRRHAAEHPGQGEPALARLGADEFALLLPVSGEATDSLPVAHQIRDEFTRPFTIDSHEVSVTTSIGISVYPGDGADAKALLESADAAMCHSKESGPNGCQLYRASLTTRMAQRLSIESGLRKALERDEFRVFYQPQVGSTGAPIIGMEALIRWQHPTRGLLLPGEFISVAEETGLIVPIGEWVMRQACQQAARWRADGIGDVRVAVNLCSLQFREPGFVPLICQILDQTRLPARLLELELTEGMLMDHCEASIAKLAELRQIGVTLSIDDFGTGYSSMNYLKSFPVNTIKIDRSFIGELPLDRDHAAITMAIIAMAHSLRLSVVAEGVETSEQAALLKSYGCEAMQGFLYGRPMSAEDATAVLAGRPPTVAQNS